MKMMDGVFDDENQNQLMQCGIPPFRFESTVMNRNSNDHAMET